MSVTTNLTEKLQAQCQQKHPTQASLAACCHLILENLKFDCVFIAYANSPEETLASLAFDGKEEVMETCLYRLGVEERVTLSKLPLKTYLDMTGKPVFNKSGSLRIQKPNSGVFMVLNRPKKSYILLGCAHQNSQGYDQKLLEELSATWKQWHESLEKAVLQISSSGKIEGPVAMSDPPTIMPPPAPPPPVVAPPPVMEKPHVIKDDGRRPLVLVDEVTRLYNKDYFSECLAIEVERAKRYSRLMSLVFLSVSPVNGSLPKEGENQVATQIAEILSKSLRRVDVICRLAPNKYGIILPDTANNTYGIIAKRIFKFFKLIMGENPSIFLNISASTFPKHAADHHALLDNAEKLLVQAQEVGPNKAVLPE